MLKKVLCFFAVGLFICLSLSYVQSAGAQLVLDWPIWVFPTATGGNDAVNYMGPDPDVWLTESWYVPVDFTGGPKTQALYVTIRDLHTQYSVSDVLLVVALNPVAYNALSQIDVSPSTEVSKPISEFILVDDADVPRGINLNQHIYKDYPPAECYYYEFHVASSLGKKGSVSPPDHVDLTVTLHVKAGVASSEGVYVHFDCSALKDSDIVTNPFSHDANTIAAPPQLFHDVTACSQFPDKINVPRGTVVNIDVTVGNLGTFEETFKVACYFDGFEIGVPQTVTNLGPGALAHRFFVWDTASMAPGVYYVKAMADCECMIAEVDEENNDCSSLDPITVYAPSVSGELFVDKARTDVISGSDPPVVGSTTVYELTVTAANTGGSDVTDVVVTDEMSTDVTFVSVGVPSQGSVTATPPPKIVWDVGVLAPGASATLTFQVSVTSSVPGLIYIDHKGDLTASGFTDTQSVSDTGHTDVTATAVVAPSPPPPVPVGGEWVRINKPALLFPWITFGSFMMAIASIIVCAKRKRKDRS